MKRYARMLLCIMLLAALLPGRTGAAKADGPAGAAGRSNEGGGASLSGRSLPDPVIVEVPEAKTDLAAFSYDNKDIELVTAGVAEGGTFYYALGTDAVTVPDSSLFSPDIPTPQEDTFPVGVYYVWYKVIGDEFHQATDPKVVTVIVPPLIACKNYQTDVLDLDGFAAACLGTQAYDHTMFFYLPKDIANGDTMLTVRGGQSGEPTDLRGITFGVAALLDVNLKKGDTVNLIYNKNGLITDKDLSTVASSELADASFLAPHNRAVDTKYELSISKKDNTTIICTVENVEYPASAPEFDPANAAFTGDSLQVSITSATPGAKIHYTKAEGTEEPANPTSASDKYIGPITITETTTIKAVAIAQGFSNSAIVTKTYTKLNENSGNGGNNGEVAPASVSAPEFDPANDTFTGDSLDVKITCATPGAEIHYTMAEGTEEPDDPTSASDKYTGLITISGTTTIKAVAVAQGFSNSAIVKKTYRRQTVQYLRYDTDALSFVKETAENCTALTGGKTELAGGWYAAGGAIEYGERLTLSGDVRLILEDGCRVTAAKGISVGEGSSLTIYAQSEGANMGSLEASGTGGGAAIGGGGTITIHGGRIEATTNKFDTAIGGGTVTIYGGRVNAVSYGSGAAIGGDTVAIYGGRVNAVSYGGGAAIGGTVSLGWTGAGDFIYADTYSGTVTLTKPFQDMETERDFFVGVTAAGDIAGKVLVKERDESPYAWTGADFILPDDLTAVGDGAFSGIAAGAVLVPANVTGVGAGAFAGSADSGTLKIRFLGKNTGFVGSPFGGRGAVVAFAPKDSDTLKNLRGLSGVFAFPLD